MSIGFRDSLVCSRSQGHPFSPRSRATSSTSFCMSALVANSRSVIGKLSIRAAKINIQSDPAPAASATLHRAKVLEGPRGRVIAFSPSICTGLDWRTTDEGRERGTRIYRKRQKTFPGGWRDQTFGAVGKDRAAGPATGHPD